MATESPIRMVETGGNWASHKKPAKLAPSTASVATEELKLLLRDHRFHSSGNDVSPNRSGSAPPSMEGSVLAINNLLSQLDSSMAGSLASLTSVMEKCESEEQLRSDPAYLAYYCANVNLNPRLPPPLISWENRRLARHIGSFTPNSGPVDNSGNSLLPMSRGLLPTHEEESEDDQTPRLASNDSVDQTGRTCSGDEADEAAQLIGKKKHEDYCGSTSLVDNQSHTLSNGKPGESNNQTGVSNSLHDVPVNMMTSVGPTVGAECAADEVLSLNDESSSSPVVISPSLVDTRSAGVNGADVTLIESGMKSLNISNRPENQMNQVQWQHSYQNNLVQYPIPQQQINLCQIPPQGVNYAYIGMDHYVTSTSKFAVDAQPLLQTSGVTHPLYANAATYMSASHPYYSNFQAQTFISAPYVGSYAVNPTSFSPHGAYHPSGPVPVVVDGTGSFIARTPVGSISPGADVQNLSKSYGQLGFPLQTSFSDTMFMQYYQQPFVESYGVSGQYAPLTSRGGLDLKKGPNHAVTFYDHQFQHQRNERHGIFHSQRGPVSAHYYEGAPNVGVLMQYPTSPLNSAVQPASSVNSGRNTGFYPGLPGHRGFESLRDAKILNFLEELKSGKSRRFELSDITGHIVEFSADQHGSRFIQQKLENCSVEEKDSVFREVLPHACQLMTDVFGNYVIQKFFEYGSSQQRKELANQLSGEILPLSLQMYGCRVIQKALDVIELEQKVRLVHELDGHVMRCVRDQNGNHVIQKCIESIPTEKIAFIISAFHGQVATLSMHPYGCRVIQRILEQCTNELQCQFIVDEILESLRALALDQYGNYVSQHVLERGKAPERSRIISKLLGHIVQLSQHKFASNVVEKCLEYGDASERELIIREIIGPNEGNDNLLIMMKDQYANYVVQKTLQICTDSQRTALISRIRAHSHALKKYTYGKHIVARFEQLFGEENRPEPSK